MPTPRNLADLLAQTFTVVGSQVNPSTITPTTVETLMEDILSSYWNKIDKVRVGYNAINNPYPGVGFTINIPAILNGLVLNGDFTEQHIQAIYNVLQAQNDLIIGGTQGRAGEFLANITTETRQTILMPNPGSNAYVSLAKISFPNDKDNGSFDNGNNFLVDFFKTPAGGQPSVKSRGKGIIIDVISNAIPANSGNSGYNYKCCITKNTGTILATSNVVSIRDGGGAPTFYFSDWDTGTIALAANDIISIELYYQSVNMFGVSPVCTIQLANGFFNHQII